MFTSVVYAGHRICFDRGLLFFGVLTPVTLDFNNQMKRIVFAMPIVHEDNEVGTILAILGTIAVRTSNPRL